MYFSNVRSIISNPLLRAIQLKEPLAAIFLNSNHFITNNTMIQLPGHMFVIDKFSN